MFGTSNSKGARKIVYALWCLLCTATWCCVTFAQILDTICTELVSPSWLLKYQQFLLWKKTSTSGFCNRVHYCGSLFVCLSGFENKAYWVCSYHLLLLFMTSEGVLSFWLQYVWIPEESRFGCIWMSSPSSVVHFKELSYGEPHLEAAIVLHNYVCFSHPQKSNINF